MEPMNLLLSSPEPFGFLSNMSLWIAAFFLLGFILVIIEMFSPGFGAPGITGSILLIIGIVLIARNPLDVLIMFLIILAVLGIALAIILKSAAKGRLSKRLILNDSLNKELGYGSTEDLNIFLGKEGIASTILRPSGTADFDGVKLDVVTRGEFIEKNAKIKVIKVEGRRVVVKELK